MLQAKDDVENRSPRLLNRVLMGMFLTGWNDVKGGSRGKLSREDLRGW